MHSAHGRPAGGGLDTGHDLGRVGEEALQCGSPNCRPDESFDDGGVVGIEGVEIRLKTSEQGMTYLADTDPEGALTPLQAAACTYRIAFGPRAGQKVLTLQTVPNRMTPSTSQRCVNAQGFSLHAEVRFAINQRHQLEHLCRYITRSAIANKRLKRSSAGDVVLQLKSPYHDGTTHIVMSPLEFMQRLAALVPRPRLHLIRFHTP